MKPVVVRVFAVVALALVAFVVYALSARFVIHGPVSGGSLANAVTRESDSVGGILDDPGRCREIRAGIWQCSVVDQEGSGGATYRVRVRPDSSCWDGALASDFSEGGMPETISGCVHLWQWSLIDAL